MNDNIYQKLKERSDDELLIWMRDWAQFMANTTERIDRNRREQSYLEGAACSGIRIVGWIQTERYARAEDDVPL